MKMKYLLLAALLASLAGGSEAANTMYTSASVISTSAHFASYVNGTGERTVTASSSARSSLLFTDAAGRLTLFEAETEAGVMTLTIRTDGAVAFRRAYPVETNTFAVSKYESNGRLCFLVTAGEHRLIAESAQDGTWDVHPAEEEQKIIPLAE